MGLSDDSDQDIEQLFQDLCADLNMDKNTAVEAWQSYEKINQNYTLEGDTLHWLACALYVACRNSSVPTVDKSGSLIEGNCVSLTRLLRSCNLSKMKKWQDMANLPQDFRNKVDRLERKFAVSTVIFKKFKPIYLDIFKDPSEVPRVSRSRKQRRTPCTAADVFAFCWTLFVQVKGNFPAITDDLVNSYHLLLSCVDLMYSNVLIADRRDLLNTNFKGLPENFGQRDYRPPSEPTCIIQLMCTEHDGLVVEAKGIKEHWWKPHIRTLFEKKILKGKIDGGGLSGIIDLGNFEANSKAINKTYEEYVLNVGDFDERIFLGDDANAEIGISTKSALFAGDLTEKMQVKRNLQHHLESTTSLAPSTPLTGRKYLKDKESSEITPVSTATQSVSKLQALLSGRKTCPSDTLLEIFRECSKNPLKSVTNRVKEMGEIFCTSYAQPSEDHLGSHIDFAKKRLQLGESLYFKALENIMCAEKKRLPSNFDFSGLLEQDIFHKSLFACCLEIVIFSYNSQRTFPWIIEVFNLEPYNFYKVIEILIRAEDGLSRDVVKHLNHIEEQILENFAWKNDSPLWDAIKDSTLPLPSCEEVSLPSQMEHSSSSVTPVLSSPLPHPVVRRLATCDRPGNRNSDQSSSAPSASDCFHSPITENSTTSARRKLFVSNTDSSGKGITVVANGFSIKDIKIEPSSLLSPVKTVTVQASNPVGATSQTSSDSKHSSAIPNKPKKMGSLGLFFRKFYHLASVRLRDLCDRLEINDDEFRKKMWTCFEYSIIQHTDLMIDRHLDQLIMCAIYVMAKVSEKDLSFQEIMKCYRMQPQAASHVYRSVLLCTKKRRHSGSSDGSNKRDASCSNSPIPSENDEREKDKEDKHKDQLLIRSSSTLPVPHPNSQPPTPTRLAGSCSSFDSEDRGDLIKFYNTIYVPQMQSFVLKFSTTNRNQNLDSPPLSPLPSLKAFSMSPRRRVSSNHAIYISPLKWSAFSSSPNRPMTYSFQCSPAKDLRAINKMLQKDERKVGKRILQDDNENDSPLKRSCPDLALRKIQNVISDRQGVPGD